MREIWKTAIVDGVENPRYQVSNLGKVKCLDWYRTGKERLCKLSVDGNGYLTVYIDGVKRFAHRLIAEAFIPNPEKKPCIDHTDTKRDNNIVDNLKWVSYKENQNNPLTRKHLSENAAKTMLGKFGDDCPNSITIVQLTLDGQFIRIWCAASEVQRELGINQGNICSCCKGRLNAAGGFKWVHASDYQRKSISEIKPLF